VYGSLRLEACSSHKRVCPAYFPVCLLTHGNGWDRGGFSVALRKEAAARLRTGRYNWSAKPLILIALVLVYLMITLAANCRVHCSSPLYAVVVDFEISWSISVHMLTMAGAFRVLERLFVLRKAVVVHTP
jgi:hypothetical protein